MPRLPSAPTDQTRHEGCFLHSRGRRVPPGGAPLARLLALLQALFFPQGPSDVCAHRGTQTQTGLFLKPIPGIRPKMCPGAYFHSLLLVTHMPDRVRGSVPSARWGLEPGPSCSCTKGSSSQGMPHYYT